MNRTDITDGALGLLSSANMRRLADTTDEFVVIPLTERRVTLGYLARERMERVLRDSGAPMVYADYFDGDTEKRLIDWQVGSVRDDFDFGEIVMVNAAMLRRVLAESMADYRAAGWYDVRLRLSRLGQIVHLPELLYRAEIAEAEDGETAHFAYVDPRNRASQLEMEEAFTRHIEALGAKVDGLAAPALQHEADGEWPVEASVIIPVRNRVRTIAEAVESALAQSVDFDFNVIVVDNQSTDGTSELLAEIAARDPRLKVISTSKLAGEYPFLGIGGCWNVAIRSEHCGRFAVQLDSDDLYSTEYTLGRIVDKFRETGAAMVIGAYTLTDFNRNVIAPGLIDHAEWTDANGPNNALRINGLGAPRAFYTPVARAIGFPNVSYGEDYAMGLAISRRFRIGRIYDSLYFCRRWEDNTDHALPQVKINANNLYKDRVRTLEILARQTMNANEI